MPNVTSERIEPGVTLLTLNRPERLNAMTADLVGELHDALGALDGDRSCRVVILTGAGRGFCAGLDLHGYGRPRGPVETGRAESAWPPRRRSPPWCRACALSPNR